VVRPKLPLISRRKALKAALKIIDAEGLQNLSIRRLAEELGVTGASLYHHFASKDEIIVGATEIALGEVRTPTETGEDWRSWLPRNTQLLRNGMLNHPEVIPIIVRKAESGMGSPMLDSSARRLIEEGVPIGAVAPLLDALEMLAIGSAIHAARGGGGGGQQSSTDETLMALASRLSSFTPDELFEIASTAIMNAIEQAAAARGTAPSQTPVAKNAATKPTSKVVPKSTPGPRRTNTATGAPTKGTKVGAQRSSARATSPRTAKPA
jgi:TetR/AcrR family transcriptional regulator, tetracycline repressor protein